MADKRQLYLLRHGKAQRSTAIRDFDRSLAPRGRKDVPRIAGCAVDRDLVPELVLCSPAARTRETAELFCESLPKPPDIAYVDTLYLASAEEILDNVAAAPEECRSLMVVGHNMGLQDLSMKLAGKTFPHDSLPTGTLAVFEVDAPNWSKIDRKNCRLIDFLRPKALRANKKGKHPEL
ncbi:MAG: SixA phosphatase family protein [Verrucomicrobiota bacterium]